MKNCIILAVMLLGFWALYVAFHTQPALADGASLRRNCGVVWNDVACQSYVRGVAEGIIVASRPAICLPREFAMEEALPLVRRFMARHPELLHQASPMIVEAAFRDAYSCRWNGKIVADHTL